MFSLLELAKPAKPSGEAFWPSPLSEGSLEEGLAEGKSFKERHD